MYELYKDIWPLLTIFFIFLSIAGGMVAEYGGSKKRNSIILIGYMIVVTGFLGVISTILIFFNINL